MAKMYLLSALCRKDKCSKIFYNSQYTFFANCNTKHILSVASIKITHEMYILNNKGAMKKEY